MSLILKNDHPMPDRIRANWLCLNGEWDFSFEEPVFDKKINVPFSWTSPLSGIGELNKKGTGYYRRNVCCDPGKNRLFLVFCGVDYECHVFVNGTQVLEHFGGYDPFDVDVTDLWKKDAANEIIVKATDEDFEYQTYGKQGYGDMRGIWQDVYLEERPASYLEKFRIVTKLDGTVSIQGTIQGEFTKFVAEVEGKQYESTTDQLSFQINEPKLWHPDTPNLYDCTLKVYSAAGVDVVQTYFGIREVGMAKCSGKQYITLNGKPIYINSTLDQSFHSEGFFTFPSNEYAKEEILRAKNMGLNAVRIHIKTEEKRKLYWADKLGMMVIEDIPCFWGEPDETARTYFETQMYRIIDRDINHPAVIYWVIFNETWGLKHFYGKDENGAKIWKFEKETQEWVRRLYRDVKAYDPTRIVEDNSACNYDHVETDVNTWHFYINGYEQVKTECEKVAKTFVPGSGANYVEGEVMGDIPVMNSECGNYWGILGNSGDSDIAWHYKYMMNEFRLHETICGFVFTELKDVINEFNGMYRLDDTLKYFGYENYHENMTIKDLHSQDYLGFDFPPMKTVKPGETVSVPLFVSSFEDTHHEEQMYALWECELETGADGRKKGSGGKLPITYAQYGTTMLEQLKLVMPEENGIYIVKLCLADAKQNIVMRNYLLLDVQGEAAAYTVEPDALQAEGFNKSWLLHQGQKWNGTGAGSVKFALDKKKLSAAEAVEIWFEASSKEELTKDKPKAEDKGSQTLDLMRGYRVDRGENTNSFYMTDEDTWKSTICVSAEGYALAQIVLEDDPADATGCLSWHYQPVHNRLEEAGSYGYLCKVMIDKDTYAKLPEVFEVSICADAGLSIFGRRSGRYPMGIEVREINA